MQNLRNALLQTSYFIENSAFDEYLELIDANKTTENNYNTQIHHIIPKSYFKTLKLPVNNTVANLVTLLYKDHVKAHWLLFCCTKGFLKKQNAMAFRKMINWEKAQLAEELTKEEYSLLQEQYEQTCLHIDKETLYSLYIEQNKSREEIAESFNCSVSCIKKFLKQYKILKNNFEIIDKQKFMCYYRRHSAEETAVYFNISPAKVQKLLTLYDCRKEHRVDSLWSELDFTKVFTQYKQGETLRSIAKKYNINESRFYTAFRKEVKRVNAVNI